MFIIEGERKLYSKITQLENGHILDHHVLGYFAPLNFKRVGFEFQFKTPAEQVAYISRQMEAHGIHFIYVPLQYKYTFGTTVNFNIDDYEGLSNIIENKEHEAVFQKIVDEDNKAQNTHRQSVFAKRFEAWRSKRGNQRRIAKNTRKKKSCFIVTFRQSEIKKKQIYTKEK